MPAAQLSGLGNIAHGPDDSDSDGGEASRAVRDTGPMSPDTNPEYPPAETCLECGFDAVEWDQRDTIKTIDHLGDFADLAVAGLARPDVANTRPQPSIYSIAEYVQHMATVLRLNRGGMELATEQPGLDLGDMAFDDADTHEILDLAEQLAQLHDEAAATATFLRSIPDDAWANTLRVNGVDTPTSWAATHVIHDCQHHLHDIAQIRHQLDDTVSLQGSVDQVSASGGGVPKRAVPEAAVGRRGLETDIQAARQHHGRPWQALCLYSAEVIEALQSEGHPIEAGSVGENLTLRGVDWTMMRSGLEIQVGEMRCRVTAPAVPCSKNHRWFTDTSARIDHNQHPGWARWYASVLVPGTIRPGDPVIVESPRPGWL